MMIAPFNHSKFRNDLSAPLKAMILACLEVDIAKRPRFEDLKRSWFYKEMYDHSS